MVDIDDRLRKIEHQIITLRDDLQREAMQRLLNLKYKKPVKKEEDVISNHDRSY